MCSNFILPESADCVFLFLEFAQFIVPYPFVKQQIVSHKRSTTSFNEWNGKHREVLDFAGGWKQHFLQSRSYHCIRTFILRTRPWNGLHVWRHTFATNQFYKGTDVKILSKILGHSETSVTYNIYIHLNGDGFNDMLKAVS
ncbi:MAG: tyrosine-type recombinase/integrase [Chloroflexi bacterium]|nr:tyrosine-type recombinase/integrase [Chloroflexota bacterium]